MFSWHVLGQFGVPTASAGAVGAMMAAVTVSMLDSCGDYIAFAKTMGYPMPPKHAVNRGIAMEGVATIVAGKQDRCHVEMNPIGQEPPPPSSCEAFSVSRWCSLDLNWHWPRLSPPDTTGGTLPLEGGLLVMMSHKRHPQHSGIHLSNGKKRKSSVSHTCADTTPLSNWCQKQR